MVAPQAGFEPPSQRYEGQASNPPVSRLMQVVYPVGSSMVYLFNHGDVGPAKRQARGCGACASLARESSQARSFITPEVEFQQLKTAYATLLVH
jgi:hypothetical protein